MNSLSFIRKSSIKEPFTEEEVKQLLSSDFEIVEITLNTDNFVESLVVKSISYPDLIDPVCKGIGLYLQDDNSYIIDPRFFKDSEVFFTKVVPDLMTDLELEYTSE